MLELAKALRRDGFVVTQLTVGDTSITLEPVFTAQPSRSRITSGADGLIDEYGGPAIKKALGDDTDAGDEDYVPAVKA